MDIDKQIQEAVWTVIPVCVPGVYTGDAEEYCTFQYGEFPAGSGDNAARLTRYLVQVHYHLLQQRGTWPDRRAQRGKLRRALAALPRATAPTVTDASDELGQHYVYEFEMVGPAE